MSKMHCAAFSNGWSADSLSTLIETPGISALVLEDQTDRIVGFVMVRNAADEGEILTIVVDQDLRRESLGKQLLEAALGIMKKAGAERVFLEVATGNRPAISLYRQFGFRDAGLRENYTWTPDGARQDALMMQLDFSKAAGGAEKSALIG